MREGSGAAAPHTGRTLRGRGVASAPHPAGQSSRPRAIGGKNRASKLLAEGGKGRVESIAQIAYLYVSMSISPMPLHISRHKFISLVLLSAPVVLAAGQGKSGDSRPDSVLAEIHGKISLSRREDGRSMPMRDQMFGMYSAHGGSQSTAMAAPAAEAGGKLSERAVIYLESEELNQGPYPLPAKAPSLDQKNLQFHPQVLPVLVGTRVEFPNRDNLFHNVFSYSQAREFDLGRYPKDDSRSVTFDRPGVVRVYCDIHAHMSATIIVLKHPYFTTPDDAGLLRALPHPAREIQGRPLVRQGDRRAENRRGQGRGRHPGRLH
jgi:plastocyanin